MAGKFAIGARVRDDGGDEGVIVEKAKGQRLVKYDEEAYGKLWNLKGALTALADNDNASPSISSAISETAYAAPTAPALSGYVNTTNGDTAVVDGPVDAEGHVWVRYTTGERSRLPAAWLTAWVPKVGERVRVRAGNEDVIEQWNRAWSASGLVATMDTEFVVNCYRKNYNAGNAGIELATDSGFVGPWWYASRLEPVVAPATTALQIEAGKTYLDTTGKAVGPLIAYCDGFIEVLGDGRMWRPDGSAENEHAALILPSVLTIETGKFYRTRDGRKVGPLTKDSGLPEWPWMDAEGNTYRTNGTNDVNDRVVGLDLVAEWVEPAAEVAVAEATATPWKGGAGTPGLTVRCEEWGGELFTAGREYTFDSNGEVTADDGSKFAGIWAGSFSLVTPAAPPAKFKVGDRVVAVRGTCLLNEGQQYEILRYEFGEPVVAVYSGDDRFEMTYPDYWFSSGPAVGATVTFTATGRLSAYTTDGHAQIVFPGLTPGQNSFALPAKFVALAN